MGNLAAKLVSTPEGLVLETAGGRLLIDFIHDRKNYHRPIPRGKNELLAKALGAGKGVSTVLDTTAGLAQDTMTLARLGFSVVAIEKNPLIFRLLDDAYKRARLFYEQNPLALPWLSRVEFVAGDSEVLMKKWSKEKISFDAVYVDPMFTESSKTALPRKEMQIFRQFIEEDSDSQTLVIQSLSIATKRVVVKRPLKGPELMPGVKHSFCGKSIRYDLYLPT